MISLFHYVYNSSQLIFQFGLILFMIVRSILSKIHRFLIVTTNKSYVSITRKSIYNLRAYTFCTSNIQVPEDELINYQRYLCKFNNLIGKPHERMRSQQQRIIQKYLNQKQYGKIINFMNKNTHNTLGDVNTASKIDEQLAKNWKDLSSKQQITAAYSLLKFRETKTFDLFKEPIEKKLKTQDITSLQIEQLIVYLCGQLINRKSLRFLSKVLQLKIPKEADRMDLYQKIYKHIDQKTYKGEFIRQRQYLLQYIGLMLDPTLNKKEDSIPDRPRSHLQINVQSFLKVLGIDYQRQVKINSFYVDYLLSVVDQQTGKTKSFILEINGNHHYTITNKLKGGDVLRNLIVNQYAPLRIVHYQEFLKSKGHRNKQAYIAGLFSQKMINWDNKKQGKNKTWELKIDEQLISSVRDE